MSSNSRQSRSRSLHFTSPEMSCNSRQSKSRSLHTPFHYHCSIWSTAKCRTPIFYGPRTKDIGPSWPEPGKECSSLGILRNCCCCGRAPDGAAEGRGVRRASRVAASLSGASLARRVPVCEPCVLASVERLGKSLACSVRQFRVLGWPDSVGCLPAPA